MVSYRYWMKNLVDVGAWLDFMLNFSKTMKVDTEAPEGLTATRMDYGFKEYGIRNLLLGLGSGGSSSLLR
jgi:hypothetical protein